VSQVVESQYLPERGPKAYLVMAIFEEDILGAPEILAKVWNRHLPKVSIRNPAACT
jgi:hypothetical protein